ncbi:MAG: ATP-binding cassette domain-containing protein [Lachnospiraceae bacterium]|nr:ATP-binding cassette domain-containing protein [Lachnospiraceae bacterium]
MGNIITVKNLTKRYVTYKRDSDIKSSVKSFFKRQKVYVSAVDDISFEVKEGDIVGMLGPNGAGKSTTIKMLTGTLYPSEGEISVMGFHPTKERIKYVKNIGAVFGQKGQLIFDIPPVDSFRLNKAIYDIPDKVFNERLEYLTKLLDLGDKINRPTRVLSLGEKMKCEFIMAMLHEPKIVFLDEPTIGLDVISKRNIWKFIREMNKKGTTFILTTHDLEDVEELVNNVIIINDGKKVFDDSLENLKKNLGNKKRVEITLKEGIDNKITDEELGIDGVKVLNSDNDLTLRFEVDMDITPIDVFITKLGSRYSFMDISVKELPMEKIIRHIYTDTKS